MSPNKVGTAGPSKVTGKVWKQLGAPGQVGAMTGGRVGWDQGKSFCSVILDFALQHWSN